MINKQPKPSLVTFSLCFLFLIGALFIGFFVGYMTQFRLFLPTADLVSIAASFAFFDLFLVESLLSLLVGLWLINGKIYFRLVGYCFVCLLLAINVIQLYSLSTGGEFLTPLAIENIHHISLLINQQMVLVCCVFLAVCVFLVYYLEKIAPKKVSKSGQFGPLWKISLVMLLMAGLLYQSPRWLPEEVLKKRQGYYADNYVTRTSPGYELFRTLSGKWSSKRRQPPEKMGNDENIEFEKLGLDYHPERALPFVTDQVYSSAAPFQRVRTSVAGPNVIVFFTEGYSARSIGAYGSKYPDLTPNITAFAESKNAMVVDNYFNHTAATYRGLHGQLCSLYPWYGGVAGWQTDHNKLPAINYYCLSHIFNAQEYQTIFFDSHRQHSAYVDEMMHTLKFSAVWTAENLTEAYMDGVEPARSDAFSDNQFYQAFIGFLRAREAEQGKNQPFFAALYSLGTHAFIDISVDGKKYGDGKNNALNTIHNLDHAFGEFWAYFKNSPYAQNTVVIFTSDHAHYPEKSFVKAFEGEDYQRLFVDRVPLIIYDPGRQLPDRYDAKVATSIDFAPSLVHYLGIANQRNAFIGRSFFETKRQQYGHLAIAAFGRETYLVSDKKIFFEAAPGPYAEQLKSVSKFMNVLYEVELTNKLWYPEIKSGH
ncbi:MAG: LTA synthase family protein [Pseudomonadales bacterium]|nr:LTA synthase family protein [Pseudomonadales bacterium]